MWTPLPAEIQTLIRQLVMDKLLPPDPTSVGF